MYSALSLERQARPRIALPLSYTGMLPAAGFESAYYRGCRARMPATGTQLQVRM